ncbi:MAG: hypothetical protein KJ747_04650 [Actinobacteria bacterium]|nr:hypothetical protein [Actinomycetota bacterium]MCG2808247.1 hypothetical protein [Coriobacteriia bacterium]
MTQAEVILQREWVLVLPVLILLLVPGLGGAVAFARRLRLNAGYVALMAFAFGVAWTAMLSITAYYARWSLSVVQWGYLAAVPVSAALLFEAWRRARNERTSHMRGEAVERRIDSAWQGFVLAAAAAVTAAIQQPWWFGTPDGLFHIAATRSLLATGRTVVTDPFFGTNSNVPDSTAGMWNTVQAVVAKTLSVDPASVYLALTAAAAFVVVLAFWVLAHEVSGSRWAATWASLAYFSFAWYTDFRNFAYPNKVSIALAFLTIALFVRMATKPQKLLVIVGGIAGFATLAVHLASGELVLICGGAIAIVLGSMGVWRRDPAQRAQALSGTLAVTSSLGLAVLLVLPTLYPRVAALEGSTVIGSDSFLYAGEELVRFLGMSVVLPGGFGFGGPWLFWLTLAIGILAVLVALKSDSPRTAAVLPLIGLVHVITLFPPVSTLALSFSSYMVARMVELLRCSPYIALAWAWGQVPLPTRALSRILGTALLVAALLTQWGYVVSTYVQGEGIQRRGYIFSVADAQSRDIRAAWGFDALFKMREIFGDEYPTVVAEPLTGYHLMGLETVAVVASLPTHTPVFMSRDEVADRSIDMTWFFNEHATNADRAELLEKYEGDYVFVWKQYSGLVTTRAIQAMPQLEMLVDTPTVTLLRVVR